MSEQKKFLDANGLRILWDKISMQDYPNNATLTAVINAIDATKADKENVPKVDATLSITGAAADARAVREAINTIEGTPGPQGPQGEKGDPGEPGPSGIHVGPEPPTDPTVHVWINPDSDDVVDELPAGPAGEDGGYYTPAVTQTEPGKAEFSWTASKEGMSDIASQSITLPQGESGADGKSAYQYALDGGYTGTEEEFAEKLAANLPKEVISYEEIWTTGETIEEVSVLELPIAYEKLYNADRIYITAHLTKPSENATTQTSRGTAEFKISQYNVPTACLFTSGKKILPYPTDTAKNGSIHIEGIMLGGRESGYREFICHKKVADNVQNPFEDGIYHMNLGSLGYEPRLVLTTSFPMGIGSYITVKAWRGER